MCKCCETLFTGDVSENLNQIEIAVNDVFVGVLILFLGENDCGNAYLGTVLLGRNGRNLAENMVIIGWCPICERKLEIGEIKGYNSNLNARLARKEKKYHSRSEQLDVVIVVNRLLTGFDAPCLSTVFIDRPPMQLHDIVQTFSRTNRLFDQNKTAGQIVTFQSPHVFKKAVDAALILYSAGGESSVLAPDWNQAYEDFRVALAYLRLIAPLPSTIADFSKEGKLRFAKAFQNFDRIYAQLKAFTCYADNAPDSYGITQQEYDDYAAWYKNIRDMYGKDGKNPGDDGDGEVVVDFDYELRAYSREKIDYEYIVSLIQTAISATDEEKLEKQYQDLIKEINKYIDDICISNNRLGELMKNLWDDIQAHPEEFRDKQVSLVLEEMRKNTIDKLTEEFSVDWFVPLEAVVYVADRYVMADGLDIPGLSNIKKNADYSGYVLEHNDISKFKYHQKLKAALLKLLREEILPLRDDDYVIEEVQ